MSNVYYRLYLAEVLALARSLVIKCEHVALTMNAELAAMGYPTDEDRPETWKYYRHLNGEYHPSDTLMTIRSMDTLEEIAFTKANLAIHRATAREYRPGSRYYRDLVRRYPNQIALINGILRPVAVDTAVQAADGTLLSYDPQYVESNESNLIEELQQWLTVFFGRWYNRQYILTDDLFLPCFLGIVSAQLPQVIMSIRLRNVNTPRAHSFHIREYLASHQRLDKYLPFLTKQQQLYLYRNVRYLSRNVGKQEVFDALVENLLTPRGIPLTHYTLEHNIERMPEEIRPRVDAVKRPVNFGYNQSGLDRVGVDTVLRKQYHLARENPLVQDSALKEVEEAVSSSQFSRLPTKVLESEVIDRGNSAVRSLTQVLLHHWAYLASIGRYRAYVTVPNPATGEGMLVSVKDALILAQYAQQRAVGEAVDDQPIPRLLAYEVLRQPLPTHEELLGVVDQRYVSPALVAAIQDRLTPLGEYINTEGFYHACHQLHRESLALWELYSFQEHYIARGMVEQVVKRHFQHSWCQLVETPISYGEWLAQNDYPLTDLPVDGYRQLFQACVSAATGLELVDHVTLAEVQRALLQLMGKLSSYSVQYIGTINQSDYTLVGIPAIRVGDIWQEWDNRIRLPLGRITALRVQGQRRHHYQTGLYLTQVPLQWRQRSKYHYRINPSPGMRLRPAHGGRIAVNMTAVGVRSCQLTVERVMPPDNDLQQYTPAD